MAELVERAVRDLIPYARNPRKNDAVVDQMAASIREFGFKVPILALSGGAIAIQYGAHKRPTAHDVSTLAAASLLDVSPSEA